MCNNVRICCYFKFLIKRRTVPIGSNEYDRLVDLEACGVDVCAAVHSECDNASGFSAAVLFGGYSSLWSWGWVHIQCCCGPADRRPVSLWLSDKCYIQGVIFWFGVGCVCRD